MKYIFFYIQTDFKLTLASDQSSVMQYYLLKKKETKKNFKNFIFQKILRCLCYKIKKIKN